MGALMITMGQQVTSLRPSTRWTCPLKSTRRSCRITRRICVTTSRWSSNSSCILRCFRRRLTTWKRKRKTGKPSHWRKRPSSKRNSSTVSRSWWSKSNLSWVRCKTHSNGNKSSSMEVSSGAVSARAVPALTLVMLPRSRSFAWIISLAEIQAVRARVETMLSLTVLQVCTQEQASRP